MGQNPNRPYRAYFFNYQHFLGGSERLQAVAFCQRITLLKTFPPKGEGLYPAEWKLIFQRKAFHLGSGEDRAVLAWVDRAYVAVTADSEPAFHAVFKG